MIAQYSAFQIFRNSLPSISIKHTRPNQHCKGFSCRVVVNCCAYTIWFYVFTYFCKIMNKWRECNEVHISSKSQRFSNHLSKSILIIKYQLAIAKFSSYLYLVNSIYSYRFSRNVYHYSITLKILGKSLMCKCKRQFS